MPTPKKCSGKNSVHKGPTEAPFMSKGIWKRGRVCGGIHGELNQMRYSNECGGKRQESESSERLTIISPGVSNPWLPDNLFFFDRISIVQRFITVMVGITTRARDRRGRDSLLYHQHVFHEPPANRVLLSEDET